MIHWLNWWTKNFLIPDFCSSNRSYSKFSLNVKISFHKLHLITKLEIRKRMKLWLNNSLNASPYSSWNVSKKMVCTRTAAVYATTWRPLELPVVLHQIVSQIVKTIDAHPLLRKMKACHRASIILLSSKRTETQSWKTTLILKVIRKTMIWPAVSQG